MAIEDSGPVAALRRELDEARRDAGDASADGARLREQLTAMERVALVALAERDVVIAAWRELDAAGATYRANRTLEGAISDALDSEREKCAAAEATLRETQHALARALETGVRAGLEAAAAWLDAQGTSESITEARAHKSQRYEDERLACARAVALYGAAIHVRTLDAASIAARIEAPPVEAAPKVGDRVRAAVGDFPRRTGTIAEVDADDAGLPYLVDFGGSRVWLRANEIEAPPVEAGSQNMCATCGDQRGSLSRVNGGPWLCFEHDAVATAQAAPPVEAAAHRAWNDAMGIWWCDVDGCREHLRGPQRAPVEAAAEPPHRVGDTWRLHGPERPVSAVSMSDSGRALVTLPGGTEAVDYLEAVGWRRVRCAPAGGDAVHVDGPGADLEMAGRGAR